MSMSNEFSNGDQVTYTLFGKPKVGVIDNDADRSMVGIKLEDGTLVYIERERLSHLGE